MRRLFVPRLPALALLLAPLLLAIPALAQERGFRDPTRTLLQLSETAEITVRQDELVAVLAVEARGASAAAVQAQVNRAMEPALARARAIPELTVSTGRYGVWRAYGSSTPSSQAWSGSQTLVLIAREAAPLLELTGQLQGQGFAVRQLTFRVSRELSRSTREQATDMALRGLRARAERAAAALELEFERFAQVDLGGAPERVYAPAPFAAAARGGAEPAPPPVAEAGEERIAASVSAETVLKPR